MTSKTTPVTVSLFVAALLVATSASAADRTFDKTVPAEANGIVEISNVSGAIKVIGWDKAEVAVHALLEEGVERVDVTGNGARTTIKVVLPKMSAHDGEADLEVRVPKGSEVIATAVSADLSTSQLTGQQRLQTVSGELRAELGSGRFEAKTVSSDMTLRGTFKPIDTRLSSVSGTITLDRGAGDVDANSVSGDVRVEVEPAGNVRLRSTSGDLMFRGGFSDKTSLDAETVSGDVELRGKNGFEYEASSFSGDIESCFGQKAERTSAYGPGKRLSGSVGNGKARLRVKSMSGDIELCDK